jgi:hypothetical protein
MAGGEGEGGDQIGRKQARNNEWRWIRDQYCCNFHGKRAANSRVEDFVVQLHDQSRGRAAPSVTLALVMHCHLFGASPHS